MPETTASPHMAKAKQTAIPRSALILGIAGLIPFACSAAASLLYDGDSHRWAIDALLAYGAVILSFLGGIRWGVLLNDRKRLASFAPLTLSVIPSLLAWLALMLSPIAGLSLLAVGLVAQYWLDSEAALAGQLPVWFGRLRLILTIGAVLSVSAGLLSQVM